jgi:hypothetical protein
MLDDADLAKLPLDWVPEQWEQSVFPDGRSAKLLHGQYFQLCVFSLHT